MPASQKKPSKPVAPKKDAAFEVKVTRNNALMLVSERMHLLAQKAPKKVRTVAA